VADLNPELAEFLDYVQRAGALHYRLILWATDREGRNRVPRFEDGGAG
jgi:hypothetical protein